MRIHQYFKIIKVDYTDTEYFRLHNETDTVGTFTCTRVGSPAAPNLEYSTDGVNWTTAVMTATWSTQVPANGNLYLRGNNGTNGFNRSDSSDYQFSMDVDHSAHGNVMSIQNYTTMTTVTAVPDYCFVSLFKNNKKLIDASNVNFGNVTSIGYSGCVYMFSECSQLQTPPDLSNITSIGNSGCSNMFRNCSRLQTSPDLSNITSIGYSGCVYMFSECSQLQTPPDLSNITSIGNSGCAYMFSSCTKLQTVYAPNIAAWSTSIFNNWVINTGSSAATPKIMYFKTQELMDSCPSGNSGYGNYTKTLL